jgi:hypothetical protein
MNIRRLSGADMPRDLVSPAKAGVQKLAPRYGKSWIEKGNAGFRPAPE